MSLCEQLSFLTRTFAPVFIRHAGKRRRRRKRKKRVRAASSVVIIKAVQATPRRRRRLRRHPVRVSGSQKPSQGAAPKYAPWLCVRKEKASGKTKTKKKEHRRFDIHYVNAADREGNKERKKYRRRGVGCRMAGWKKMEIKEGAERRHTAPVA